MTIVLIINKCHYKRFANSRHGQMALYALLRVEIYAHCLLIVKYNVGRRIERTMNIKKVQERTNILLNFSFSDLHANIPLPYVFHVYSLKYSIGSSNNKNVPTSGNSINKLPTSVQQLCYIQLKTFFFSKTKLL